MADKVNIALLGFGTVGMGVCRQLRNQEKEAFQKTGSKVTLSKVLVRNANKAQKVLAEELVTTCFEDILSDDAIDIVVEVMGGIEPARTYLLQALSKGKHVVTANKDLMASHGGELLAAAAENKCDLMFEGSVAGAIPVIRPLKQCLAGNEVHEIMGIINGTTNYILTRMSEDAMQFSEALVAAQKMGYAEADPASDIEGLDAARKIAILASVAFHSPVTASDVHTEGISKISLKDIKYAAEFGYVIKLLGLARGGKDGVEVRVYPALVQKTHPLATVRDAFNAVFIRADAAGEIMLYGSGAGALPTASAVLGDVFDIVRNINCGATGRIGCTCYKTLAVKNRMDSENRFFLRLLVEDRPGVLAGVAGVFGNHSVSLFQVVQKPRQNGLAELVIITDTVKERHIHDALAVLGGMSIVDNIHAVIRVI